MNAHTLPLYPDYLFELGAVFSEDRVYRYLLPRRWDPKRPPLVFVGTNPSYADETTDDNTTELMIRRAKEWGFGRLEMVNCFAYRETNSKNLRGLVTRGVDLIGPENDKWLMYAARAAHEAHGMVLLGYGQTGNMLHRGDTVTARLRELGPVFALKLNRNGTPCHPLYLPMALKPFPLETK